MSLRNRVLSFAICLFVCVSVAPADEPQAPNANPIPGPGILLFRSGRTIEGEITETNSHYVVVRPVGKVEVPKGDVDFVAGTIEEVYQFKLARIIVSDPDEHIRLAQWCVLVNHREWAIEELERAAELSPNPARPNAMLESLRRTPALAKPANNNGSGAAKTDQPVRAYPSFQKEVSPALVSTFSIQVQPLLVRSCATAGCHNSAHSGSLILLRSSVPSQRISQQNLRAALAHVDPQEPDASPLLTRALQSHGASRRPPIDHGPNDPAFLTLAHWVRAVSGRPAPKPVASSNPDPSSGAIQPAAPQKAVSAAADDQSKTAIFSNKPLAETPARIRAGMFPSTTDSSGQAPPASTPGATGAAGVNAPHPLKPQPAVEKAPDVAKTPKDATPTSPLSKLPTPDQSAVPSQHFEPKANIQSAVDYQPVDPFDPEVFNRQFSPRAVRQGP